MSVFMCNLLLFIMILDKDLSSFLLIFVSALTSFFRSLYNYSIPETKGVQEHNV